MNDSVTEEAVIVLLASSLLYWDGSDISPSTTNVPIKNLSILQQTHVNHSLSTSQTPDVNS